MAINKHPLFTLREMEERARTLIKPPPPAIAAQRWVGLLVRIGEQRLLVATTEIREVFSFRRHPKPSPVPGAKTWLKGLASLRGELLSIVDLGEYLHRTPCQTSAGARVIVTKHASVRAGLLVDEVIGLRQFDQDQRSIPPPASPGPIAPSTRLRANTPSSQSTRSAWTRNFAMLPTDKLCPHDWHGPIYSPSRLRA